jgi:hypothetical protein|tara:strand:+ start:90 stop:401 length:312 start_codon:yes stop_codon:yes gene_type:complete
MSNDTMSTTIIIIRSDYDNNTSIPDQLHDVGKKLAKLLYSPSTTSLNDKSIIVIFPSEHSSVPIKADFDSLKEVVALQNSIRHIVQIGIKHGIDIKIQEHPTN